MKSVFSDVILAVIGSQAAGIIVKVTVIWALGLTGAWLACRGTAALRHALLAAAFGVTLVLPITSLFAPPVQLAVPIAAQSRSVLHPLMRIADTTRSVTAVDAGFRVKRVSRRRAYRYPLYWPRVGSSGR